MKTGKLTELGREAFLGHLLRHPPEVVRGESRGWDGLGVGRHAHEDFYQLDYFTGGTGTYEIGGTRYEIWEHSFFCSCPGEAHAIEPVPSREIQSVGVKFRLAPIEGADRSDYVGFDNAFGIEEGARAVVVGLLRRVVSQAILGDSESLLLASNGMRELLAHLCRLREEGRVLLHSSCGHREQAVERVWSYLRENLREGAPLSDLSRHVGLSRFHLARVFRAATGKTPHEALTQLRLERGKALVLETGLRIAEVSRRVGFKKTAYFSALFKEAYGVSPRVLRARHRAGS